MGLYQAIRGEPGSQSFFSTYLQLKALALSAVVIPTSKKARAVVKQ